MSAINCSSSNASATAATIVSSHAPTRPPPLRREHEAALGITMRVATDWTVVYQGVATVLSALHTIASRADLAERVRPTALPA